MSTREEKQAESKEGQGAQRLLVPGGDLLQLSSTNLKASLFSRLSKYRDLAHIIVTYRRKGFPHPTFLTYIINRLQRLPTPSYNVRARLSLTHYLSSSYRYSTHLFTVKAPILIASRRGLLLHRSQIAGVALAERPFSALLTTVLSPTFLPLHESPCYRSSNHSTTASRPTISLATTVLSPTKASTNPLNFHRRFSGKDVFKICIKKTSVRLMMFFLIFQLVSSRRRNPTHEQC
jgi:hypothetical protein